MVWLKWRIDSTRRPGLRQLSIVDHGATTPSPAMGLRFGKLLRMCFLVQMLTCMNFSEKVTAAKFRQDDVSLLEIEAEVEDLRGLIAEQEKIVNLLKGHDCPPDSPICLQKRAGFAQRMYRRQVSKTFD
jgi:hypothetical protein